MKEPHFLLISRLRSAASVALLGVFLVLGASTLALADGHFQLKTQLAASSQHTDADEDGAADETCPVCPESHHSGTENSCCCSHFHTSLVQLFTLNYSPMFTMLEFIEPFRFIPDVFPERFIPPQNRA